MNKKVKEAVEFCKRHKWKIITIAAMGAGIVIGVRLNDRRYKDAFVCKGRFAEELKKAINNPNIIAAKQVSGIDQTNMPQAINDFINTHCEIDYPANFKTVDRMIFFGEEK